MIEGVDETYFGLAWDLAFAASSSKVIKSLFIERNRRKKKEERKGYFEQLKGNVLVHHCLVVQGILLLSNSKGYNIKVTI